MGRKRDEDAEACDKELRLFHAVVWGASAAIGSVVLIWLAFSAWADLSK